MTRSGATPSRRCHGQLSAILLLVLSLLAVTSVEALKCYDCLSKVMPECANGAKATQLEVTTCSPDERYCSVLALKNSEGQLIVSRQCASRKDEGRQLMQFLAGAINDKNLQMEMFVTCKTDLCNTQNTSSIPSANALLLVVMMALAVSYQLHD